MSEPNFLSRWAQKKAAAESPKPNQDAALEAVPAQRAEAQNGAEVAPVAAEPVPLPNVESLTAESDFSPFMQTDVAPELRNQAMKKLFTDPHYNIMDRLDTYIDDYGAAEPIPESMLRMMTQSATLGLFDHEKKDQAARTVEVAPPDAAPLPVDTLETAETAEVVAANEPIPEVLPAADSPPLTPTST